MPAKRTRTVLTAEAAVQRTSAASMDLLQGQQAYVVGEILKHLEHNEALATRVLLLLESGQLSQSTGFLGTSPQVETR